jgi:hypothetical protein
MSRSNSAVEAEMQIMSVKEIEAHLEYIERMSNKRPSVTDAILEAALVLLMVPLVGILITLVVVSIQQ